MPIALAKLCRADHAKVAREICAKIYNPSRKEWYYGIRQHAVVLNRHGKLPTLLFALLTPANDHDLPAAKQIISQLGSWDGALFAGKAYADALWKQTLLEQNNLHLLTPHRRHRGVPDPIPGGSIADTFISSVRQKIEFFFGWLNRLTDIQPASKVRFLKGLFLHVFGRLAAALASPLFNC